MANEAILKVETEPAINFKVADGVGISKGAVLALSDPITASSASANNIIAGIAAQEKIADDGVTTLAIYRRGIFIMNNSGGVTAGDTLAAAGSNQVQTATATEVGTKTIGTALETATTGNDLLVELNPGVNMQTLT